MLTRRPHYRPIPQGAEIITKGGRRFARWTNNRGKTFTRPLNDKGDRIVCDSRVWYSRLKNPTTGEQVETKAYSDKTASAALDYELLVKIERGVQGLIDPMDEFRKRPIVEHLDAYENHLTNKENSAGYVEKTMQRCRDIIEGIKATVIGEALASLAGRGGHDPACTLMVGDREHDVHGAAAHGIDTLGAAWGYALPGELELAGAVGVVGRPDDLADAVLALLSGPRPTRGAAPTRGR